MDHYPGGVFFLLFIAFTVTCSETAGFLPAPTNIRYEWLDPFILQVTWSWQRPAGLPPDCKPVFWIEDLTKKHAQVSMEGSVEWNVSRTYSQRYLSEDLRSGPLSFSVAAECSDPQRKSQAAKITIQTKKPHVPIVENFKCFEDQPKKCTWNPTQKLRIQYRHCGRFEEKLKECTPSDEEYACSLNDTNDTQDVCVVVETDTQIYTFRAERAVRVPPLHITEDKNKLLLTWTPSEVRSVWVFDLWYKECNTSKYLQSSIPTQRISYDPCCIYEFHYRVYAPPELIYVSSVNSSVQTYGSAKCYNAGLVAAIVVPILLFFCVMLSIYCFRRHRDIICPNVPYPSNLLKELMNGTKDPLKPTTLPTPNQEEVDDVQICLASDGPCPQSV
ncbi:uncharacterized protein LOC101175438 [Oryzias latipes]|uniref:uncharacterized protein LOC101175438 n=1 Tax=Oryzias latipes TaxID=8090 RepID=UPI0005CB8B6F|nr:uncharacterized protein LOC101175438 [Oryzias latipes]